MRVFDDIPPFYMRLNYRHQGETAPSMRRAHREFLRRYARRAPIYITLPDATYFSSAAMPFLRPRRLLPLAHFSAATVASCAVEDTVLFLFIFAAFGTRCRWHAARGICDAAGGDDYLRQFSPSRALRRHCHIRVAGTCHSYRIHWRMPAPRFRHDISALFLGSHRQRSPAVVIVPRRFSLHRRRTRAPRCFPCA